MNKLKFLEEKYNRYLLECFSNTTGLHLKIVDTEGNTFLDFGNIPECNFCKQVKESQWKRCKESYKKAVEEASKWREPYFFRCHAGLVIWAVPIVKDEDCLGCLICGQVLLWDADEFFIDELREMNRNIGDFDQLCENAHQLKVLSAHTTQAIVEILQVILNYLSESNDVCHSEQQKNAQWRNVIQTQLFESKNKLLQDPRALNHYLAKEKRILQLIRMGNQDKAMAYLPVFFSEMYIMSDYNFERVKIRMLEFMFQVSRSVLEAGLEDYIPIAQNEAFFHQLSHLNSIELLFDEASQIIEDYMNELYLRCDQKHRSLLRQAREFIDKHYSEPLRIEHVAEVVGLSASYLSMIFKESFKFTVNEYILKVRVENAIRLMQKHEISLKEIAQQCGFNTPSHFAKVFKKQMGITPTQFRNQFIMD
ncbi:MAG: PocR ligand-binding domain-containing protein [Eubacterium sp.]